MTFPSFEEKTNCFNREMVPLCESLNSTAVLDIL